MSKLKPGYSTGKGKSKLPKDEGVTQIPGFLGRTGIKTKQAREYCNENRLGTGGKGREISLPKAK